MNARRVVSQHSLLPEWKIVAIVLLGSLIAITAAFNFADAIYINWLLENGANKTGIFALTTDIGKSDWLLVSTGSILIFMSLYQFPKLSAPHLVHWHHIFLKLYFVFTTTAFCGLLAIVFKNIIGRARPVFFDNPEIWTSSPFADSYLYASFPSGHSTTMGALAAIAFLFAPRSSYIFIPLAIWVAVSRMVVGAHFPSDVVAGLALGVVFTWVYARMFARKRLLFTFDSEGRLKLRNLSAKRARRKIRKNAQSLGDLGFQFARRAISKKA